MEAIPAFLVEINFRPSKGFPLCGIIASASGRRRCDHMLQAAIIFDCPAPEKTGASKFTRKQEVPRFAGETASPRAHSVRV